MNKNYKEYKIWRFAYDSYVDKILVPDDVKLYCINKDRSNERSIHIDKLDNPIWNETYIAVIPYSEELWELSNDKRQSYNLYQFNVNNIYIIWVLDQVYPLCSDFPETNIVPVVPTSYIRYRTLRLKFHKAEYTEKLNQIKEMNLSKDDEESLIKETFMPIYEYIKIHGLDNVYKGYLDITRVIVKTWSDGEPVYNIKREYADIKEILQERIYYEKLESSSEDEYNKAFNDVMEYLK